MLVLVNVALYCSKAEIRVPGGGWGGWCKPIIMSNPQPSCFGLLLGWVAVAWLGFGVITISKAFTPPELIFCYSTCFYLVGWSCYMLEK